MVDVAKSALTMLGHFSAAATVDTLSLVMEGLAWTSMSVPLTMVDVAKSVPTMLGHFSVVATVDLCLMVMEGLVPKLMSAL